MTDRPSDRAYAQAVRELENEPKADRLSYASASNWITRRAREIDAAAPEGSVAHPRNPLLAYADSYRTMATLGDGRVSCLSVACDIEKNMAPRTAPPSLGGEDRKDAERYRWLIEETENGAVDGESGAGVEIFGVACEGSKISATIDAARAAQPESLIRPEETALTRLDAMIEHGIDWRPNAPKKDES